MDEIPTTFVKRAGTTDAGKDYEHLLIANIILKLVTNDDVENFLLSSNDGTFGSFDDVVVELKYRNSENFVTYAIQLKHNDKGRLTSEQLAGEKGDFSINKYLKDYLNTNNLKRESVKLILLTNCKFYEKSNNSKFFKNSNNSKINEKSNNSKLSEKFNNFQITLHNKACDVEISSNQSDELISTTAEGSCFTLKSDEKCDGFFENFFLYTSQLRVETLKKSCLDKFRTMFSCDESIFNEYMNFITTWSMIKGKKKKLNKDWMRRAILVRVLSPFIQTLSFKGKPSNPKIKILQKAFLTFQVTILHKKDSFEQLRKNWENAITDVDVKEVNKTNRMYQVTADYLEQIDESIGKDVEINKILWLMGKCPLVIEGNGSGVKKALNLLARGENFIILSPDFDVKLLKSLKNIQNACLECLRDLQGAREIYDEVLDRFGVSIEGQKEATLREIVTSVQNVESDFSTDALAKLANDPLLGSRADEFALRMHYVPRTLTRIIIDSEYLQNFDERTLVIVTHVNKMSRFKEWCERNKIFTIDISLRCNEARKSQLATRTVYVTKEENCSQQHFNELCEKHKKSNYHQFRYISCNQLEWTRSKNGVSELRQYQLNSQYIQESELFSYSNNNLINVICENAGMGKTTLMKNLKCATPSTCWTIFIMARNCGQHLLENQYDIDNFLKSVVKDCCKDYSDLDKLILNNFFNINNIQIVWDGIDESSTNTLEIIMKMIVKINKKGLRQWLTSRVYLTDYLEQQFNVFSRTIQELNESEQMNYIKNRLGCSDEVLSKLYPKIKSNIDLLPNNSILGIPLQIFMLTELLIEDINKYLNLLDNVFTIADLYKHFVEKIIYDHYEEKKRYNFEIDSNREDFEKIKINKINEYKKVAIQYYLERKLDATNECEKLLLEIKNNKDPIGFVIKVTDDMNPQFSHNSYGEYFAALYLSENHKILKQIRKFYLSDKFRNIRFFLDLIWAENCKAHIALLYDNSQLLDKCTDDEINLQDKIDRTCLDVSLENVERYRFVKTYSLGDCYEISYFTDYCLKTLNSLKAKCISNKKLKQFEKATLPLKKIILLFPFVLSFLKENEQIDGIAIPSILYYAIKYNHKIVLNHLKFFPFILLNVHDRTLLHLAVELKRVNFIKSFASNSQYNMWLVKTDLDLWYKICALESTDLLKVFKNYGCDLNKSFLNNEWTVAHYICSETNDTSTLKFLIENGADINLTDSRGFKPIHLAYKNLNASDDMKILLINYSLHLACKFGDCDNDIKKSSTESYELNKLQVDFVRKTYDSLLQYACEKGQIKIVEYLVELKRSVNVLNQYGKMAIHFACKNTFNGKDIVKYLVRSGSSVNECNKNGIMPIHIACKNDRLGKDIVKYLVECGSSVNECDKNGNMPIHYACTNQCCSKDIIKYLVECGSSVNECDKNGNMPIHYECTKQWCSKDIIKYLVECGSSVNECDKDGSMPIHIACKNKRFGEDVVKYLVECGSNVNECDKNGSMPIHIACENEGCGKDIVKYLVECGSSVNECDKNGNMPIHIACTNERLGEDIVKYLVECGSSVNECDKNGNMPIHYACTNQWYGKYIIKYLVECGSSVNECDKNGSMPIHYACTNQWYGKYIIKYLVECGSSVNECDKNGSMPIHYACTNQWYGKYIIKYLVECGSSVNKCDKNGNMPIHIACTNTRCGKDIVKYLIENDSSVNVSNRDGNFPIHLACRYLIADEISDNNNSSSYKLIKLLVVRGAKIDDFVLLHYACEKGHIKTIKYLIKLGAKVNVFNHNGKLPIHFACMNKWWGVNIVKHLIKCGSSVNVCDENGNMPIHIACKNEECGEDIVKYLVKGRSLINVCNKEGNFPLHLACGSDCRGYEIIMFLIKNGADVNVTDKNGRSAIEYIFLLVRKS